MTRLTNAFILATALVSASAASAQSLNERYQQKATEMAAELLEKNVGNFNDLVRKSDLPETTQILNVEEAPQGVYGRQPIYTHLVELQDGRICKMITDSDSNVVYLNRYGNNMAVKMVVYCDTQRYMVVEERLPSNFWEMSVFAEKTGPVVFNLVVENN